MPTDNMLYFSSFAFHNHNISPFPHFPKSVYFSCLFDLMLDNTDTSQREGKALNSLFSFVPRELFETGYVSSVG